MKCEGARELFSEYLEGSLEQALSTVLRGHMDACSSCKEDYDAFRLAWGTLDSLPDIAPPVDFRHNIVMGIARAQHEQILASRQRSLSARVGAFVSRLVPARAAAVAGVAIAVALVVLRVPDHVKVSGPPLGTGMDYSVQFGQEDPPTDTELAAGPKLEWQSRKLGRNSLWVSVNPKRSDDGRMLYRVMLSINGRAMFKNEVCNRIGAEVYLLPPGMYSKEEVASTNMVWHGNIINDSPVVVPVIIDRTQSQSGSVNLLVTWRFRGREFAQIVYLPSKFRGSYAKDMYSLSLNDPDYMSNHADLYTGLQSIAEDYGVLVIANATVKDKSPVVAVGDGDLEWRLRSTLKPVGLDWAFADHAIYVDRKYM